LEINWSLLQPVDTGAAVQQGFATGAALVSHVQRQHALQSYLQNPDSDQAYNALASFDPNAAATIQHQQMVRHKLAMEAAQEEQMRAIGSQAASGDVTGARNAALGTGNFDLAKQLGELSDDQLKKTGAFWEKAGPLAYRLKELGDPGKQRELWDQARPILEASGADPQIIAQFDPTNPTQLDAAISTAQTIAQQIEQRKITWHQQGEQPSFATDSMGRPIGSQNPYAAGGTAPASAPHGEVAATLSTALPPHVVAGFLGNFDAEGGYGGAKGDGGTAQGIAQWRGERAANFERVIGKPVDQATPAEQSKFVLWEMQNPEAAGMTVEQRDRILASKDAGEAASLIDQFYERSSGEHRQKRIAAAHKFSSGPAQPSSKADYDALPKGTPYIAPDGSRRVKS
jgi:hypothetical protein